MPVVLYCPRCAHRFCAESAAYPFTRVVRCACGALLRVMLAAPSRGSILATLRGPISTDG